MLGSSRNSTRSWPLCSERIVSPPYVPSVLVSIRSHHVFLCHVVPQYRKQWQCTFNSVLIVSMDCCCCIPTKSDELELNWPIFSRPGTSNFYGSMIRTFDTGFGRGFRVHNADANARLQTPAKSSAKHQILHRFRDSISPQDVISWWFRILIRFHLTEIPIGIGLVDSN